MIVSAPDRPWLPDRARTIVRGRVMLKVASGEAPEDTPHYLAVAAGRVPAASRFDGGPVDRVLRAHSPGVRIMRAFAAARGSSGDWDPVEDRTGVSRTFRLDLDPDVGLLPLLSDLRSLAVVETASPIYLSVTPFAEHETTKTTEAADPLHAHHMVGVQRALAFEPGDASLILGVVDSGVSAHHRELSHRLRPGVDTVDLPDAQVSRGITLIGDTRAPDRDPADQMGHGTACASIIAARGLGVPPGAGGAVRVLPARALAAARVADKAALTAVGSLSDIDHAVKLAVDLGARILNLSFGTPDSSLRDDDPVPHADVIEYALRRGCVLVAASGNSGGEDRYFPAAHPGVIAVGSVGAGGRPSAFTTRGPHVALSAPGEHIPTAGLDGYVKNSGTSFAAPFVAGACALLSSRAARYGVPLDRDAMLAFLTAHARPFPAAAHAEGCGAGILDIPAALEGLERVLARNSGPTSSVRPAVGTAP